MIVTEAFAIAPATQAKAVVCRAIWQKWWLFALPIAISGVLSVADIRFLMVTLMMIFIVTPMIVAFIYLSKLMTPENIRMLHPHRVIIYAGNHIEIRYDKSDDFKSTPPDEHIEWTCIRSIRIQKQRLTFELDNHNSILIPLNAIPETADINRLTIAGNI